MRLIAITALSAAIGLAGALPAAQAGSYRVVYTFQGGPDGGKPRGALLNVGGMLYGTTEQGGAGNFGTVFRVDPATGAAQVVYAFKGGTDGAAPFGGLVAVGTRLYGTTLSGGAAGFGTIFSINPTAGVPAAKVERVDYSFKGGNDGANPQAGLINVGGTLYGTTYSGGPNNTGTVFSFVPKGSVETVLHAFGPQGFGDAYNPAAGLINVNDTLYGTATGGGATNYGAVFSVNRKTGAESILHSFFLDGKDGYNPFAGLTLLTGKLYGTTVNGGKSTNCGLNPSNVAFGCGTVFAVNPKTNGQRIVRSFAGAPADAAYPLGGLLALNGLLYGTTVNGGSNSGGAIFAVNPSTGADTLVYSFQSYADGYTPRANLINVNGTLYGTNYDGGSATGCPSGCGTVFAVVP